MRRLLALALALLLGATPGGPVPAGQVLFGPVPAGPVLAGPVLAGPVLAGPVLADRVPADHVDAAQPASASAGGSWLWPVPAPHPLARPFVAPVTAYTSGHRGIDIRTVAEQVFAPAAGVVSFAGMVVDRPVLSIRHAGGVVSSYEPVQTALSAGDAVASGELIGTLLPGHCVSLCLHFGVRVGGQYVSPLLFLEGIPPSVLLPTRR
ncbi:MAG: M23 family metallopeptidase [Rhodoglobus sp.]